MSKPSEWAVKAALELLIRWPWARSHLVRPCDTERAIALALDAAREAGIAEGRRLERGDVLARLDARPHIPGMPLVLFEDEIRKIVRGEHVATKEAK